MITIASGAGTESRKRDATLDAFAPPAARAPVATCRRRAAAARTPRRGSRPPRSRSRGSGRGRGCRRRSRRTGPRRSPAAGTVRRCLARPPASADRCRCRRPCTFVAVPAIASMCSRNGSVGVVTASARRGRASRSSHSANRRTRPSPSSPSATATSGQRSRTSRTHGTRNRFASSPPDRRRPSAAARTRERRPDGAQRRSDRGSGSRERCVGERPVRARFDGLACTQTCLTR